MPEWSILVNLEYWHYCQIHLACKKLEWSDAIDKYQITSECQKKKNVSQQIAKDANCDKQEVEVVKTTKKPPKFQ